MKEDFSELIEYLDGKFKNVEDEFSLLKTDVTILKEDVSIVKTDVVGLKDSFNELQTAVDAYAKKADKFFEELVMLSHKVDRHEKWLLQIAEKLGIKLEY